MEDGALVIEPGPRPVGSDFQGVARKRRNGLGVQRIGSGSDLQRIVVGVTIGVGDVEVGAVGGFIAVGESVSILVVGGVEWQCEFVADAIIPGSLVVRDKGQVIDVNGEISAAVAGGGSKRCLAEIAVTFNR